MRPTIRRRLAVVHRWTAIVLSPVLLAVIVTGGILAFAPLMDGRDRSHASLPAVDVAALRAQLTSNPAASKATVLLISDDRRIATVSRDDGARDTSFVIATGVPVPAPKPAAVSPSRAFFASVQRIHKHLWRMGGLVGLASFALGVLVILGPFLSPPGARRGALGWHRWTGWFLLPILALAPLSLLMMKLQTPVPTSDGQVAPTLVGAIDAVAMTHDVRNLSFARLMRHGGAFVLLEPHRGEEIGYIVSDEGRSVQENDNAIVRAGKAAHTGDWAGGWGGILSFVAALALLGMLVTGLVSWVLSGRRRAARVTAFVPQVPRGEVSIVQ